MGARIAGRFVDAGHRLVVWNRTAERAAPLVARGAERAATPADAARAAEALIVMVSDPAALAEVAEGSDGIVAGAGRGLTVVQMSTVDPAAVSRLASMLPRSVGLLDAPVLGSTDAVEAGSLILFVGGPDELFARCSPLLSVLGTPVHVGPLGAGTAAKLVANATLLNTLGILGEALALADRVGLPRDVAFEILSHTPLAAQAERRRAAIENEDYPTRFAVALARKDAELILGAAAGAKLPLTSATAEWLRNADDAGLGDADYTALLAWILRTREPPESCPARRW